ncbi:MAG: hypothetical protein KBD12_00070 [Candidatus Pacebacteria bacterium]|nr:hypothetical protein [Candidatus Paceibacterota bacterium]
MNNKAEETDKFYNVKESWDDKDIPNFDPNKKKGIGFTFKFFIFSLFIFILASGFALYSFYSNSSSFSKDKIDFFINAPISLDSGNDAEVDFSVTNKNTTSISEAYIIISYNSGENISGNENLITKRIDMGEILPNTSINKSISISLFGNESDVKNIDSTLFYKVPASKAEFNRTGTPISVLIKSSPVSISVNSLKEVHQNNNFDINLSIVNNTNNEIKNLLVSARPPNDFVYSSSSLPTYNDNPSWLISKLKAGEKKSIVFSGKLTGPLGEVDKFNFFVGLPKSPDSKTSTSSLNNFDNYNLSIDNIYSKTEKSITIAGQYLNISIITDSTSGSDKVSQSDLVSLEFIYKNNLDLPLDNIIFIAKLSEGIDYTTIDSGFGSFDSDNNAVVWDKSLMPELSQIPGNGTGKIKLKFKIDKDALKGSQIHLQIFGKGDRNSESGVSNEQNLSLDKSWVVN